MFTEGSVAFYGALVGRGGFNRDKSPGDGLDGEGASQPGVRRPRALLGLPEGWRICGDSLGCWSGFGCRFLIKEACRCYGKNVKVGVACAKGVLMGY